MWNEMRQMVLFPNVLDMSNIAWNITASGLMGLLLQASLTRLTNIYMKCCGIKNIMSSIVQTMMYLDILERMIGEVLELGEDSKTHSTIRI